jgi:hypothetical protein
MTDYLQDSALVKAYHDRPRIIIVSNRIEGTNDNAHLTFSIDLRSDTIRASAIPGQRQDAVVSFNAIRGLFESINPIRLCSRSRQMRRSH